MSHRSFTLQTYLFLLFSCSHVYISTAQLINPISIPIIKGQLDVHTAPFAQIPKINNGTPQILCIVPYGPNIYVGTQQGLIFKINKRRRVSLWFNVGTALLRAGSPGLSDGNSLHDKFRSVAFPPDFRKTGYFYTSQVENPVTNRSNHHFLPFLYPRSAAVDRESAVSEWRFNKITNRVPPSSHRELFRVSLRTVSHPIQQIAFNRSRLFITHGDSSTSNAVTGGGQNPDGLGKILSIRPRGKRGISGPLPYEIPLRNPFVTIRNSPALGDRQKMIPEVWALGFRNPHNLCFSKNGTLFVADIGRRSIEEVNIVKKGLNYGWSEREGTLVHFKNKSERGNPMLPENDENEENRVFEYPAAQFGHSDERGMPGPPQAVAGGCLVENGSPISGNYFYSDFSFTGRLFYSHFDEMMKARTNGKPNQLTQARTREANIFFDDDDDPRTPPIMVQNLRGVVIRDPNVLAAVPPGERSDIRADVRFGRGSKGEIYWSSKTNGKVYVLTSSLIGGPGGPVRTG